jgi:hypothetical protein
VLQPFKGLRHRVSLQSDSSRISAGFRAFRLGEKAICVSSVSVNLQSFRRSVMSRASYHSLPVAGSRRYYVILCAEKACPTCLWNDNETHRKCSRAPASLFAHLSFLTPEPLSFIGLSLARTPIIQKFVCKLSRNRNQNVTRNPRGDRTEVSGTFDVDDERRPRCRIRDLACRGLYAQSASHRSHQMCEPKCSNAFLAHLLLQFTMFLKKNHTHAE